MFVLSAGKNTILSEFETLNTKCIYNNAAEEVTDFQFWPHQRIFVESKKKSGLEILRINEKDEEAFEIQRIRKLSIENVFSVACAKQSMELMALGLLNGQVKIYNYKVGEMTHRFKTDNLSNSILSLDFNASDEYLASVYESGHINVYGLKTNTKMETLHLDGYSIMARFHPVKRFHLSVASYKGSVSIYDIQTKKQIYNANEAHGAPCRDVAMSVGLADTVLSVGYDCMVNIYDTRRRTRPVQVSCCHPLSTVALSVCGKFFCAGNLKGEIVTYDIRNLQYHLESKRVHNGSVARIAFVPPQEEGDLNGLSAGQSFPYSEVVPLGGEVDLRDDSEKHARRSLAANLLQSTEDENSTPRLRPRDSFCEFMELYNDERRLAAPLTAPTTAPAFGRTRDSFDWEGLARQPNREDPRASLYRMASGGASFNSARSSADSFEAKMREAEYTRAVPRIHVSQGLEEEEEQQLSANADNRGDSPLKEEAAAKQMLQRTKLKQLNEEHTELIEQQRIEAQHLYQEQMRQCGGAERIKIMENTPIGMSQKRRQSCDEVKTDLRQPLLGSNSPGVNVANHQQQQPQQQPPPPLPQAQPLPAQVVNQSEVGEPNGNTDVSTVDVISQLALLRSDIDTRFKEMECEIKAHADTNKWQMFTHTANYWNQQKDIIIDIHDSLSYLMQTDPFINEFIRLKEENQRLKIQIENMSQK